MGARAYGVGAKTFFDNIDPNVEGAQKEEPTKQVLVLVTSDRGLCGAVHTSIVKEAKNILNNVGNKDVRVVAIGDKARVGLQRLYGKSLLVSGNEIGRAPPTFADASIAAKAILDAGFDFETVNILYFTTTTMRSAELNAMRFSFWFPNYFTSR
uniref:ATP synthase subunit gamma n=1 Tax=Caenorhabditis japonica TaxID=281687 RepID=A0A8R1HX16_CAEJA